MLSERGQQGTMSLLACGLSDACSVTAAPRELLGAPFLTAKIKDYLKE